MFVDPAKKFSYDPAKLRAYIDELEKFRNTKLRVGYTAGAFDLFHRGHMHILREARKHCDFLVVSVNADHHIAQNKGPDRPVWVRENRAYAVANTDVVSSVLLCDPDYIGQTGKYRLSDIEHQILKPDVAFFGSDYNIDTIPEHRRVWAPELVFIDQDFGTHTSQIVAKMTAGKPSI